MRLAHKVVEDAGLSVFPTTSASYGSWPLPDAGIFNILAATAARCFFSRASTRSVSSPTRNT